MEQKYTRTTNGAKAYSQEYFKTTNQKALTALNNTVATKTSQGYQQYLQKIFVDNTNKEFKVYGAILIMHFRDIDKGKGLRKPFLNSLIFLYKNGYEKFVINLVKQIPKYGYYKDLCNLYKMASENQWEDLQQALIEFYSAELKKENKMAIADKKLTNCAKFAPRQQKKFDKFSKSLSRHMFPDSKVPDKEYRNFLKKIMDKYKQITEVLMSAKRWDEIDPKYVPSLCFNQYKKTFLKYEGNEESRQKLKEKYEEHIQKAIEGKDGAKINAKRLTIDNIVQQHNQIPRNDGLESKALEAQVLDIINDVKKNAKLLEGCLAVCDVSGSMSGDPMNACIGLGLIVNEINQMDFKNSLITFSSSPSWINLENCVTFRDKIDVIRRAPWGGSTDFYKTMKLIADEARIHKKLPKAIFVFSDMQFNQASYGTDWKNTYENIRQYYKENGFSQKDIPSIIFWNLRTSVDNFVVDSNQKKVICISGYSQNLIKSIVQADDLDYILNLTPFTFLLEVLNSQRYGPIKEIAEAFF